MSFVLLCAVKFEGSPTLPRHLISVPVSLTSMLSSVQGQLQGIIQELTQKMVVFTGLYPANIVVPEDSRAAAALVDAFISEPHNPLTILDDVSDHWSTADFAARKIHIVVEVRECRDIWARAPEPDTASSPTDYFQETLDMRALATACYTSMDTPSSLAHPRAFRKLNQGSEKNLFHNLRPADARGKPVSLFHPVFGAFLRDLNDPELAMPSIDFATLFEFMGASAAFYRTEEARWEAVRPLLKQLTGLRFTRITLGNNTSPTRMARTSSHVASIIVEMRNELGADGDVTLHAAACYGKCIVDETFEDVVKTSCCPVILLVLAGAHLCVLGAVFTDKVVVEPLTDFILCVNRPEDAGARTGLLARLMQALRNAHARLDAYYAAVQAAPPPARTPIFPYRDSWTADGATSTFSYDRPVAPHKLLWFATLHGGKDEHIVVKFAKRYDADAHALLASAGYAPRLYHADPPSASNEWRMVVMERITIVELEHTTPEDRLALQQDVCAAVELLHDAGRVFGDLRQGNVLIQKPGADRPRPRAVLVDFDWAGREGEARYPYDRNDVNIEWPDGSRPGGVIERAHDAVWLERLVEYFS